MHHPPDARAAGHRARLTAALAAALAEQGYGALTVADVVRRARVSRRTFYEHFAGKEECLLALYEEESDRLIGAIEAALRGAPHGASRVRAGVDAYLRGLQARPGVVRALLVEILAAGERGLAVRRAVNRRFAGLLLRQMGAAGVRAEGSAALAAALVGGINELVLEAAEEDRLDRLVELGGPIAALVRSVFVLQPEGRGAAV